jgi:chromosomal replication initiation ATPase DnaA
MIDSLLLHDLAHARPVRTPYIDIERQVALRHGITVEDLRGPCRARRVAWPRQELMWRARRETRLSLPQIGERLGGRDHTTVIHGVRAHQARLDRLRDLAQRAARDAARRAAAPGGRP